MADFLFEIGLEEVPARMIAGASAELERRVIGMLVRERLVGAEVRARSFATPRRLAVVVAGVAERQADVAEEMMGPSVKVGYKDGVATAAALAFAKKAGVEVGALRVVATAKGEYLAATSLKAGAAAVAVIAAEMPKELAGIYWAKNMYWRAGKPERFVRPVRWMAAMLGGETVPVEFAGYVAGDVTYGHRVLHGAGAIRLGGAAGADEVAGEKVTGEDAGGGGAAAAYEKALREAYVVADVEARRQRIRKELDRVCRRVEGARWREDHALVDKLTHLTEWPTVILGGFEREYLELPEEVLVTVMRDHQSYFAVEDGEGKLAPYFLAVLNTEADAAGEAVIRHGNERVLRARFNDARFFWEFDQRVPLGERKGMLEKVTFQKDLGSYGEKTRRVSGLVASYAALSSAAGVQVDEEAAGEAGGLAKTDLTTELVKEFTELQGVVGGLYARAARYREAVWRAVYDQYKPTSMTDSIPSTIEGQMLSLTDKVDTIAGMFSLGLEPTGSKDPFALRRAANGVVRILAEGPLALGLREIISRAVMEYAPRVREQTDVDRIVGKMMEFFAERLEFYLREARGQAYDVVKAVLAVGADDVRDAVERADAVAGMRASEDFRAVSAAFKRMKNILAHAREKGYAAGAAVDESLLSDESEIALAERSATIAAEVGRMRAAREYRGALEAMAGLRPQVDAFFEGVMVMAPDAAVRGNRLALLERVLRDFSGIADFSEIVVAG